MLFSSGIIKAIIPVVSQAGDADFPFRFFLLHLRIFSVTNKGDVID